MSAVVDLHQTEPGLPVEHPWLVLSRWGMAWRAALGLIAVGLCIVMVMAVFDLDTGDPKPGMVLSLAGFGAPQLLVFVLVAAVLGPWLRRYYPFSQALLFGGIGVGAAFVLAVPFEIVAQVANPSPWGGGLLLVLMIAGLPFFLTGAIGYGFAIWSVTRKGARVFWPLLAAVLALYVTLWTLHAIGAST